MGGKGDVAVCSRPWLLSTLALALGLSCGLPAIVRADCLMQFVPPARSPHYCAVANAEQVTACRIEGDRIYGQQVAAARSEWERQQLECRARDQANRERQERDRIAREQAQQAQQDRERVAREQAERAREERDRPAREQAERQRREAAQRAADEAQRQRTAADTERYIAQQKAAQAAAELERQRVQTERSRQEAETAKAQAEAAEAQRRIASATDRSSSLHWNTPVPWGSVPLFGLFAWLVFQSVKEWIHASVPKKWKIIAFAVPGVIEIGVYFFFGIEMHEPTVADIVKLNAPFGIAAGTGFAMHHAARYAFS